LCTKEGRADPSCTEGKGVEKNTIGTPGEKGTVTFDVMTTSLRTMSILMGQGWAIRLAFYIHKGRHNIDIIIETGSQGALKI
jgi:hypothetical protein